MKRFFMFVVLSVLILIKLACTSKSSTGPTGGGSNVIASDVIGKEGGTVGNEDFILVIPANAFDQDEQLEVSVSSQGHPFEDNKASDVYYLKGLPETFHDSLTLKIKHTGNLVNSTFTAFGETLYLPDLDEEMMGYTYYEGQDSSGFIISKMPCSCADSLSKSSVVIKNGNSDEKIKMTIVTDFFKSEVGSNTMVCGPSDKVPTILSATESVLNRLNQLDLSSNSDKLRAVVSIIPSVRYDEWRVIEMARFDNGLKSAFSVDASRIDDEEVIPQLGRCFFQFYVQGKYAPPSIYSMSMGWVKNNRNIWLHAAIAAWSECYFAQDENFIPSYFLNYVNAPFCSEGLAFQVENYTDHIYHGCGMSSLIRYLVENDSVQMIMDFYSTNISEPHLIDFDIRQELGFRTWWPAFINTYLSGDVFSFNAPDLIEPINAEWIIDDESDVEWQSDGTYKDISCDLIRFSFDYDSMANNASLYLNVESLDIPSDSYKLFVYTYDGSELNFLGEAGQNDLVIDNVKDLCTDRQDLILALVKSAFQYPNLDGSDQIVVNAEIKESSSLNFDYAYISCNVFGYFDNTGSPGGHDESSKTFTWTGPGRMISYNTFETDTVFTTYTGQTHSVNITVVFDPDTKDILTFTGESETVDAEGKILRSSIQGSGPMPYTGETNQTKYQYTGDDVCDYIDVISYYADTYGGNTNTLTGFVCNSESMLDIVMYHGD